MQLFGKMGIPLSCNNINFVSDDSDVGACVCG